MVYYSSLELKILKGGTAIFSVHKIMNTKLKTKMQHEKLKVMEYLSGDDYVDMPDDNGVYTTSVGRFRAYFGEELKEINTDHAYMGFSTKSVLSSDQLERRVTTRLGKLFIYKVI